MLAIRLSVRSSLLEPLTGASESSSKMINSYIIPPEMANLTLSGQPQRSAAATDCIYCRGEADAVVTSYGTVTSQRAAAARRPLVVASLDAVDRKCAAAAAALDAAQWPAMTTSDYVDSGSSRVAVLSFSDAVDLRFHLDEHTNYADLSNAISMHYR